MSSPPSAKTTSYGFTFTVPGAMTISGLPAGVTQTRTVSGGSTLFSITASGGAGVVSSGNTGITLWPDFAGGNFVSNPVVTSCKAA